MNLINYLIALGLTASPALGKTTPHAADVKTPKARTQNYTSRESPEEHEAVFELDDELSDSVHPQTEPYKSLVASARDTLPLSYGDIDGVLDPKERQMVKNAAHKIFDLYGFEQKDVIFEEDNFASIRFENLYLGEEFTDHVINKHGIKVLEAILAHELAHIYYNRNHPHALQYSPDFSKPEQLRKEVGYIAKELGISASEYLGYLEDYPQKDTFKKITAEHKIRNLYQSYSSQNQEELMDVIAATLVSRKDMLVAIEAVQEFQQKRQFDLLTSLPFVRYKNGMVEMDVVEAKHYLSQTVIQDSREYDAMLNARLTVIEETAGESDSPQASFPSQTVRILLNRELENVLRHGSHGDHKDRVEALRKTILPESGKVAEYIRSLEEKRNPGQSRY